MNTRKLLAASLFCLSAISSAFAADKGKELFIVAETAKTPDTVVAALKTYALDHKWIYLGDNKVKNGEISLVKMCVPSAGKNLWAAGPEVSAMAPCGNLGVYQKEGKTYVSLLNPMFMNMLKPDPNLKKVGEETLPLFTAMLDSVTK